MISFILNDTEIKSPVPAGTPLLDVIRNEYRLRGTKLACGEGECGACTVLIGTLTEGGVSYHSVTSCIMPLINAQGKHVVTIEGLNLHEPNLVQQEMIACNGTQCGFCTPGFVVSMTGALIGKEKVLKDELITAADGNICRCTGYKSIERAAELIAHKFNQRVAENSPTGSVEVLPPYFNSIKSRLTTMRERMQKPEHSQGTHTGGGTDLYVQKPYMMRQASIQPVSDETLKGISVRKNKVSIGAGETMSSIQDSTVLKNILPDIRHYLSPVGSRQIRNMATLGGNLANASPIGDLTILFLGLDADIVLEENGNARIIKLKDFYIGYKSLAKSTETIIKSIEFVKPDNARFHFERVCKRTYLDVASVNSACLIQFDSNQVITTVHCSAGGVAPIPKYLNDTGDFLQGKEISTDLILDAEKVMQQEISPISDIRGSAAYKRLLLRQLFFIHMTKLSPLRIEFQELLTV